MQDAKQMSQQLIENLEAGLKELREQLENTDANHPVHYLLISNKIAEQTNKLEAIKNFRKAMGYE